MTQDKDPTIPHPIDEWCEEIGPVLWWKFPVDEPPYLGSPLDSEWGENDYDEYYTHWTHLVLPEQPEHACEVPEEYVRAGQLLQRYVELEIERRFANVAPTDEAIIQVQEAAAKIMAPLQCIGAIRIHVRKIEEPSDHNVEIMVSVDFKKPGEDDETFFDQLRQFWNDHYVNHGTTCCVLCGNTGIVDTRNSACTPTGKPSGGRRYCICPNGRAFREQGHPLGDEP